jgi:hypothetical protein
MPQAIGQAGACLAQFLPLGGRPQRLEVRRLEVRRLEAVVAAAPGSFEKSL